MTSACSVAAFLMPASTRAWMAAAVSAVMTWGEVPAVEVMEVEEVLLAAGTDCGWRVGVGGRVWPYCLRARCHQKAHDPLHRRGHRMMTGHLMRTRTRPR